MNFMSKKADMRQNSIITLSDHNRQELEDISEQKEKTKSNFETKKKSKNFLNNESLHYLFR